MLRICRIGTVSALALVVATRLLLVWFHAFGYVISASSTHPDSRTVVAEQLLGGLVALDLVVIGLAISGIVHVGNGRAKAGLALTAGALACLGLCLIAEVIVFGRELLLPFLVVDLGPAAIALAGAVTYRNRAARAAC